MSVLPVASSEPQSIDAKTPGTMTEKPPRPKKKGRNLAQLHAKSLPLEIHPLPAFHPSNPISLLRLAYTWLSHVLYPPTSHPLEPYVGHFSPETRSVHITDPKHVRALWEMGFFGKGTLSRSEPSWLEREKARLTKLSNGGDSVKAAEDATKSRREERRLFKLERARLEREKIERQRLIEDGKLDPDEVEHLPNGTPAQEVLQSSPLTPDLAGANDFEGDASSTLVQSGSIISSTKPDHEADVYDVTSDMKRVHTCDDNMKQARVPEAELLQPISEQSPLLSEKFGILQQTPSANHDAWHHDGPEQDVNDQEHLQLTLEEAFFLAYGLGVLSIFPPTVSDSPQLSPKSFPEPYSNHQLLEIFSRHSTFPPMPTAAGIAIDDPFLLNYVVYHHFRSLGWVVRPGVKFAIDFLLYNRGPVFSHAEFAIVIIPSYSHRDWNSPGGRSRRRTDEQKDWWWLHAVNRVQSQVKKTLVLCYVDIPSPFELELDDSSEIDIGRLLKSYTVREFIIRRWIANRSRD